MVYRILKTFKDGITSRVRFAGETIEMDQGRAQKLRSAGVIGSEVRQSIDDLLGGNVEKAVKEEITEKATTKVNIENAKIKVKSESRKK